ncbi:hypothetical protein [Cellulomonas sp. HZM]|uniref:hypothetical protein n=1 Tax=Cellulomonas sp. HZM TaxID=1454010 RepID=UPI0004932DAC|nr:hypothetical protein [Cellulomonas sp. HZM]
MSTQPEQPVDRTNGPATAVGAFFAFLLFVGGLVLFTISFDVDTSVAPWTFVAGIAAVTLAFMVPTTIIPALEDRAS